MADVDRLLARHRALTDELAAALRSLGDIRGAVIRMYADTWRRTENVSVTERRETCKVVTVDLDVEAAKLVGEVDALRAELADIELAVNHAAS